MIGVSWIVGDRVRIVEGGQTVCVIRELDYQGDPNRVLVEPEGDAPGKYAWPAFTKYLVPADSGS